MLRISIERGMLKSRVARRVFLVFVACALLPIFLFAAYALSRVTNQLRDQADRQLHRSVKATGMTVVAQLDLAAQDLDLVAEGLRTASSADLSLEASLRDRLAHTFSDVKLHDPRGRDRVLLGAAFPGPALTERDWRLLAEGKPLVRTLPPSAGASRVALVLPTDSPGEAIVGRVLSDFLWSEESLVTFETIRICLDANGRILFDSDGDESLPDLAVLGFPGQTSGRFRWEHDGATWLGRHWQLFMKAQYDAEWNIIESLPEADALASVREFRLVFLLLSLLSLAVVVFLSLSQIRKQLVPIETLREATQRIAEARFDERVCIETGDEFEELGESFNAMAADLEKSLRMQSALIDLGIALTAEGNRKDLLQILLRGIRQVLNCDGSGVVVLGSSGETESFASELGGEVRTLDRNQLAGCLPAERMEEHEAIEVALGCSLRSVLTLALRDQNGDRIGTLYAMNARSAEGGALIEFSRELAQLGNMLAAQASAALTQNRLVDSFRHLFDGMTKLIATAIDEKSPFTHGHCQRVPIATMILADAVCRSKDGPYADFSLTPDERYELEVAALLHDCGKVVTPVHVIDKATKLETIIDRIALVRTRFEVVARDRRIERLEDQLRAVNSGALGEPAPDGDWEQQLAEDLEFLVRSNKGGEFFPREAQERVREIGSRYEFCDQEGKVHPILTDDEIVNLSISRGTLTDSERKIIQDHVVSSIKMLEMLPYPKNLARVPLIAGAHHEWMNGNGYPSGIQIGDLPLQARILALADVFEALTAKDRPYKDQKTLSEALRIMGFMRLEGQIDPDLFDFFLTERVYLEYARLYLEPHQVDEVDLGAIPGCEHLVPKRLVA